MHLKRARVMPLLRSSTPRRRRRVADAFQKPEHGIQVRLPVRGECFAMTRSRYGEEFFRWIRRSPVHSFSQCGRHSLIRAAGDEQDWSVDLANCGFHVAVVRIESDPHAGDAYN